MSEQAEWPITEDHERIWLEPKCTEPPGKGGEGRQWCQDDVWGGGCEDYECGAPSVEYVRVDLFDAQASRIAELEALVQKFATDSTAGSKFCRICGWPLRDGHYSKCVVKDAQSLLNKTGEQP